MVFANSHPKIAWAALLIFVLFLNRTRLQHTITKIFTLKSSRHTDFQIRHPSLPLTYHPSNVFSSIPIRICDRSVPTTSSNSRPTWIAQKQLRCHKQTNYKNIHTTQPTNLVLLGYHDIPYGQTNNRLNTLFHAMDYANDVHASLAVVRNTWPSQTLRLLFGGAKTNTTWETAMECGLNLSFVDRDDGLGTVYNHVYRNTSRELYYYHTDTEPSTIAKGRGAKLRYLWTAVSSTTNENGEEKRNDDACSALTALGTGRENGPYTVVHSRWMKTDQCTRRLRDLAHHIRKNYKNDGMETLRLDRSAPCVLQPDYVEFIVRERGMLHRPIYVVSDGKNPDIVRRLRAHPVLGKDVRTVPDAKTWVGGDMTLGVLADVFIGNPISTMSGNIARARVALGLDPSSNYLFPLEKRKEHEDWTFFCQNVECLYDYRVLNHYVG